MEEYNAKIWFPQMLAGSTLDINAKGITTLGDFIGDSTQYSTILRISLATEFCFFDHEPLHRMKFLMAKKDMQE